MVITRKKKPDPLLWVMAVTLIVNLVLWLAIACVVLWFLTCLLYFLFDFGGYVLRYFPPIEPEIP